MPPPELVGDTKVWEWGHRPGHLYLSTTDQAEIEVRFVEGALTHTVVLTLHEDTVLPLAPVFHPGLDRVQVRGSSEVEVEQVLYMSNPRPVANTWWVWATPDFAVRCIVLYPHSGAAEVSVRLPDGTTASLSPGRRNRLIYPGPGVYQVQAAWPFRLDVWFEL